jgi:subtilisin family serine protease
MELTPQEIVRRTRASLDLIKLDPPEDIILTAGRIVILRGPRRTLATVVADVPSARRDPRRLVNVVRQLHRAVARPPLELPPPDPGPDQNPDQQPDQGPKDHPPEQGGADAAGQPQGAESAAAAAAAPRALDTQARATADEPVDFRLRAASPNWLGGAAQNIGGGGPGAWPISALPTPNPSDPQPWDFEVPVQLQPPLLGPAPVEVAILDTVPKFDDLSNAYDKWVGNDLVQPPIEPLESLNLQMKTLLAKPADAAGDPGTFNVVDMSTQPDTVSAGDELDVIYIPDLVPGVIDEHQYPMSSHGLFIAGVIRSIAPQAKLRMIQVLDNDGIVSLESVTRGLEYANHITNRNTPLVINCSFTMFIPRAGDPSLPQDLQGASQAEIDNWTQLLRDLFTQVNQRSDVVVVAAVGNDGGISARYPAAFDAVSGVAALQKDDLNPATDPALTDYSNATDDQPAEGFAAFGGEKVGTAPPVTDAVKGMLGLFIGHIPVPGIPATNAIMTPNLTGWVRWAGTSFATPIVSAVIANLFSTNPLQTRTQVVNYLDQFAPNAGVHNSLDVNQRS